jgi:hypothetical protein
MTKVKFKAAYDERKREGFQTTGESLTQQHFAQEADIKTIIKKHDRKAKQSQLKRKRKKRLNKEHRTVTYLM